VLLAAALVNVPVGAVPAVPAPAAAVAIDTTQLEQTLPAAYNQLAAQFQNMEEGIIDGYAEVADALRKLQEPLQRNTTAFSGQLQATQTETEFQAVTPQGPGQELFPEEKELTSSLASSIQTANTFECHRTSRNTQYTQKGTPTDQVYK
jgi:hypothetical protein